LSGGYRPINPFNSIQVESIEYPIAIAVEESGGGEAGGRGVHFVSVNGRRWPPRPPRPPPPIPGIPHSTPKTMAASDYFGNLQSGFVFISSFPSFISAHSKK